MSGKLENNAERRSSKRAGFMKWRNNEETLREEASARSHEICRYTKGRRKKRETDRKRENTRFA